MFVSNPFNYIILPTTIESVSFTSPTSSSIGGVGT